MRECGVVLHRLCVWYKATSRYQTTKGYMDHAVYLARIVPRMCLNKTHELYKDTHDVVYEYVCDTYNRDLTDHDYSLPPEEDEYTYTMYCRGKDVRTTYPMVNKALNIVYSMDPVRPAGTYAVIFQRIADKE